MTTSESKTINLSYTATCLQCGAEFTKDYGKAPARWPRFCDDNCGAKFRWYANRSERLAQKQLYREANKDTISAKNRQWREMNRPPPKPSIREELETVIAAQFPDVFDRQGAVAAAVDDILLAFTVSRRRNG